MCVGHFLRKCQFTRRSQRISSGHSHENREMGEMATAGSICATGRSEVLTIKWNYWCAKRDQIVCALIHMSLAVFPRNFAKKQVGSTHFAIRTSTRLPCTHQSADQAQLLLPTIDFQFQFDVRRSPNDSRGNRDWQICNQSTTPLYEAIDGRSALV